MGKIKNATIRIPSELADWLTADGQSINQAVISCAENLKMIRIVSTGELKGLFTVEEWKFLIDSLNGTIVDGVYRCNVSALVALCEDSEKYNHAASRWGVDINGLCEKIKGLKGAHIDAIYSRTESFWANPENDIEEWAKF